MRISDWSSDVLLFRSTDDRGQAGAGAKDQAGEQRRHDRLMQAERQARLGAVEEAGQGEGEAGDDQRDPPAGNGQMFGQGPARMGIAVPARAHPVVIRFNSSSGAKSVPRPKAPGPTSRRAAAPRSLDGAAPATPFTRCPSFPFSVMIVMA